MKEFSEVTETIAVETDSAERSPKLEAARLGR